MAQRMADDVELVRTLTVRKCTLAAGMFGAGQRRQDHPQPQRPPLQIGVGRPHIGTPVLLLIDSLNIREVHAATGELLREFTLDPTRTYQPTGAKQG